MINDIRYSASQLLQISDLIPVQEGTFSTQEAYQNTFEELIAEKNNEAEIQNLNKASFMPLGIPAGFNIDFSLLDEMENQETGIINQDQNNGYNKYLLAE